MVGGCGAGCLVISPGPWALNPHFRQRKRLRSLGEPRGGRGWAGLVASASVCLFLAQPQNHQAFRGPLGAPPRPWNSQQVTASLGSDRWGTDKGGPCALPGAGMGPQLSLWGAACALHLGEFPLPKSHPAQLSFLHSTVSRGAFRRQPLLHRPCHSPALSPGE